MIYGQEAVAVIAEINPRSPRHLLVRGGGVCAAAGVPAVYGTLLWRGRGHSGFYDTGADGALAVAVHLSSFCFSLHFSVSRVVNRLTLHRQEINPFA